MQKGHVILCLILFLCMATLPCVAVIQSPSPQTVPTTPSPKGDDTVTVLNSNNGVVTDYSVKEYLFGVVAAELPMSYPEQAIKAQAIAAYTLMLHRMEQRRDQPPAFLKGADMTDDSGTDQAFITRELALAKWGEKGKEYAARLDGWIDEIMGLRVEYKGSPALTVYHSISGGRTESAQNVWGGDYPYLTPVESVGDLMSEGYISEKTYSQADFLKTLSTLDASISADSDLTVGEPQYSPSGTVLQVELCGKSFSGKQLRSAFSLRSANFDIDQSDGQITFTVRGHGHLVGMSQYGAKTMAEQGSTYEEILTWYYPNCSVTAG